MPTKYSTDEIYKSRWLKAADLPEESDMVVTIKDVNDEQVGEDKELKLILSFKETDKELVLNKTNATVLQDRFGTNPNLWINKRIALFTMEVAFAGKMTLAVRIRIKPPTKVIEPPEPEPIPDNFIPVEEETEEAAVAEPADY